MTELDRADGPLHDAVVEQWGIQIASGLLRAGSAISAEEVGARYGVSRSVVREAVRVLQAKGLVEVRRRVGITVRPVVDWDALDTSVIRWRLAGPGRLRQLAELAELRAAVEPVAAGLAADRATDTDCGALTAAVVGMAATSRSANADAYLRHDADFHTTLLRASGNPLFARLAPVVTEVLEGRTRHELMPATANPDAVAWHADVAAAVQRRDPAGARAAMARIVAESAQAVSALPD